jgi:hypothetical protein
MKSLITWVKDAFVESLNQTWTLLGMFVAWCVLTGSARTIVGYAILLSLSIWLLTIHLRESLDSEISREEKDS